MTATVETYTAMPPVVGGNEALAIINRYRRTVDDHFYIEPLECELPSFSYYIGGAAVHLAHTEDNLAGSFKWRGAFVGAHQLAREGHEALMVPSAGNHARGAILAAKALGLSVHTAVPRTAPVAKREQLASLWPSPQLTVHVEGETFDDSLAWSLNHPELGTLLHPYNDPYVTRGQGTLVDDVLKARPDTQHIVLPVGGGGLMAGVLRRLLEKDRADIVVHAVEAPGSNSLSRSLEQNQLAAAEHPNAAYGGSAVTYTGEEAMLAAAAYPNLQLHTADEDTIHDVIDLYEVDRQNMLRHNVPNLEPTSLVAIAGLKAVVRQHTGEAIVAVATGQNAPLRAGPAKKPYRLPL